MNSGVPKGSCLGPLLFNIYVSSLFDTIGKHQPTVHSYADDFQVYLSFRPSCGTGVSEECVAVAMQNCVSDIESWARLNSLMLNDGKTEFIVIGTRQQLAKTSISSLHVGEAQIPTSSTVKKPWCVVRCNVLDGLSCDKDLRCFVLPSPEHQMYTKVPVTGCRGDACARVHHEQG